MLISQCQECLNEFQVLRLVVSHLPTTQLRQAGVVSSFADSWLISLKKPEKCVVKLITNCF